MKRIATLALVLAGLGLLAFDAQAKPLGKPTVQFDGTGFPTPFAPPTPPPDGK